MIFLGLLFLVVLGVLFGRLLAHDGDPAAAEARRLAVLPFENLGRPQDEYFADGITDEIRGKLAGLPGLQVTASSSSSQYKKTGKTPQEIGRELGVEYLLIGKVRWEKGASGQSRVRVSPELVQVATASTRWQQPFDAALTDVFQVQADVASRVAQAMNVTLAAGEQEALAGKPTADLPAYDLYLQGNEAAAGFDQVPPLQLRRSVGYYERAVALDSTFALAWAQLSRAHSYIYQISRPETTDAASGAGCGRSGRWRSLPAWPRRHLAQGDYLHWVRRDDPAALEAYARDRKLAPNNADAAQGHRHHRPQPGRLGSKPGLLHPGPGPRPAFHRDHEATDLQPPSAPALPGGDRVGRPGAGARPARGGCVGDEGHGVSWGRATWPGRGR